MRTRFLVFAMVLGNAAANAGIITEFSNFGPALGRPGLFYPGGWALGGDSSQVLAAPFTPGTTATLLDVVLALGSFPDDSLPLNVYLESDDGSGTVPGSILAALIQNGAIPPYLNGSGGGLVTFSCGACPVLNAGTEYWIVPVNPAANSQKVWMFSNYDLGPGAYDLSNSSTGPWSPFPYSYVGALGVDAYVSDVPEVPELSSFNSLEYRAC